MTSADINQSTSPLSLCGLIKSDIKTDFSLPLNDFLIQTYVQYRFVESISSLPKKVENKWVFAIKRFFNKAYQTPQINWGQRRIFDFQMLKGMCQLHANKNNYTIDDIISFKDGTRVGVFIDEGEVYKKIEFEC